MEEVEDGVDGSIGVGVEEDSVLVLLPSDSDVQEVIDLSSSTSSSSICFNCGFRRPRYELDHEPRRIVIGLPALEVVVPDDDEVQSEASPDAAVDAAQEVQRGMVTPVRLDIRGVERFAPGRVRTSSPESCRSVRRRL